MSIEAIAYAKTLRGMKPGERLLLYVIAENTFNDTGKCRIGSDELAFQMGVSIRTVHRYVAVVRDKLGLIKMDKQPKPDGGSSFAHIELVGFVQWLADIRKPKVTTVAVSDKAESDNPDSRKCQQVSLSNKENPRTSTVLVGETRARVRADGSIELCPELHATWLEHFGGDGERLRLALIECAGLVQVNSRRPLESQIGIVLARIAGERRDRDRRYETASKRNGDAAPAKANGKAAADAEKIRQINEWMKSRGHAQ